MLRFWLVILGLSATTLIAASCTNPATTAEGVAAAQAGAIAAQAGAVAATQAAGAVENAAASAAQTLENNAVAVATAVQTGQPVSLPTLPDDGQTIVFTTSTVTYVRFHGQQLIIPKPRSATPPTN